VIRRISTRHLARHIYSASRETDGYEYGEAGKTEIGGRQDRDTPGCPHIHSSGRVGVWAAEEEVCEEV